MTFTTRPVVSGTLGVATSTHWIASAVGMSMLEKGGNAFDAAVAMGFVLNVVEPHLNGPLGDLPVIFCPAGQEAPTVICGQGVAPAAASIEHYRDQGMELIPGSGLLATVVPGAFDGWMLLLRDHGSMSLREVLEPAIHYAAHGHPLLPRVSATIADLAVFFQDEWPTSVPVWLPSGDAPEAGSLFCNPDLAATWQRLLREAESAAGREAQIEKAREAFYRGFIAESIGDWLADACVMDAAGQRRKGVLSADDMANWQASVEPAWSTDYHDWTVWKTGPWGQGPVLPQALNILRGSGIENITADSADFVHTVTEAMKLAFADREAYYGDPNDSDIPLQRLLDIEYANHRRELIGPDASTRQRPGAIAGFERLARAAI